MKRRRKSSPLLLFWSRTEQRRFIDAVERLVSTAHDLAEAAKEILAARKKRRKKSPHEPPLTDEYIRQHFPDADIDQATAKSGGLT
jgi:hypothetical protein